MDTPILLMDEPFSALDPLIREEMQQELLRLQSSLNKTIVFVTHDPNEAATLGDRIAILLKGQVVQDGRPLDIVLAPANDYVRDFIKGIDVFKLLSAGQITDASRPPVVLSGGSVGALQLVRPNGGPVAVTDGGGRLLGIVEKPSGLGNAPAEWERALTQDFVRLPPEMLIASHLDELSKNLRPVVVVREDGTLVGMVTGSSVLKALAAHVSGAAKTAKSAEQEPTKPAAAAIAG
jgi:glycine betaine/proline transport system ATP-binding protein